MVLVTLVVDAFPCSSVLVRDSSFLVAWSGVVEGQVSIELRPGLYILEAYGSSAKWRKSFKVSEEPLKIELGPPEIELGPPDGQSANDLGKLSVFEKAFLEGDLTEPAYLLANPSDSLGSITALRISSAGSRSVFTTDQRKAAIFAPQLSSYVDLETGWPVQLAAMHANGQQAMLLGEEMQVAVFDVSQPAYPVPSRLRDHLGRFRSTRNLSFNSPEWEAPAVILDRKVQTEKLHLALWSRRAGEAWKLNKAPSSDELRSSRDSQRFLRVTSTVRAPWLIALPCSVERIEIPKDPALAHTVRVVDADPRAELIQVLMTDRDFPAAASLAVSSLNSKRMEATGVVEVAVAVLKLIGRLKRDQLPPLDWFYSLTIQFPWLPDALIAYGWFGSYMGELSAAEVLDALLKAAYCGVPGTTAGLTLLRDGLEFAAQARSNSEAGEALKRVRSWLASADRRPYRTHLNDSGTRVLGSSPVGDHSDGGTAAGIPLETLGKVIESRLAFELILGE